MADVTNSLKNGVHGCSVFIVLSRNFENSQKIIAHIRFPLDEASQELCWMLACCMQCIITLREGVNTATGLSTPGSGDSRRGKLYEFLAMC